jgi:hypothetical protein
MAPKQGTLEVPWSGIRPSELIERVLEAHEGREGAKASLERCHVHAYGARLFELCHRGIELLGLLFHADAFAKWRDVRLLGLREV